MELALVWRDGFQNAPCCFRARESSSLGVRHIDGRRDSTIQFVREFAQNPNLAFDSERTWLVVGSAAGVG